MITVLRLLVVLTASNLSGGWAATAFLVNHNGTPTVGRRSLQLREESCSTQPRQSFTTVIRTSSPTESIHDFEQRRLKTRKNKDSIDSLLFRTGLQPVQRPTSAPATNRKSSNKRGSSVTKRSKQFPTTKPIRSNALDSSIRKESLSLRSQLDYARNGHAALRNIVDSDYLLSVKQQVVRFAKSKELEAWKQKVQVASNSQELARSCQTVADCQTQLRALGIDASLPFLQYFNTWRELSCIKELAYSLGEAASVMMDVPSVRLYQDAVFWKRTVDGPTPWHVDARMAPFDTSHYITFWIPLDHVAEDGTGLLFCSKSHNDFALPYWNPRQQQQQDNPKKKSTTSEWDRLAHRYPREIVDHMPLNVGDVTVHNGFTLHCANGNSGPNDRVALTISFVDATAEIRPDALLLNGGQGDNEDQWSYKDWAYSVAPRSLIQHKLVPIVWPRKTERKS